MARPLFRPVKPFSINQRFGENAACVNADKTKVIVCDGNNPPLGFKSLYGPGGHKGVDLYALHGQHVYCALDGIVSAIDTNERTGLDVKVVSEYQGRKLRHIYEHLSGYQVKVGQGVPSGALLGWAGNTGYSAGTHLHFELQEWLGGKWVPIDPMPLMSDFHAQDIAGILETIARVTQWITDQLRKR